MDNKFRNAQKQAGEPNSYYQEISQEIQEVKEKLSRLVDDKDELMKLRQENGNLRRKLSSVHETVIDFYRLIERTLNQPDVDGEYRKATEKLLFTFDKYLSDSLGVKRIVPLPGEPFQDECHKAIGYESLSSTNVSQEFIYSCANWGYRVANWGNPTDLGITKHADVNVISISDSCVEVASVDKPAKEQQSFSGDCNSVGEAGSIEISVKSDTEKSDAESSKVDLPPSEPLSDENEPRSTSDAVASELVNQTKTCPSSECVSKSEDLE